MIYGYCRISTPSQNIARQVRNIAAAYPDAEIVEEVYTGRKMNRPKFEKLLKKLKGGDTVVFDEVSRMSRDAGEGYAVYRELYGKGVNLVFLKEPQINTDRYRESLKRQIGRIETGSGITDKLLNAISDALQEYIMDLSKQQIADAFGRSQAEVDYLRKRTAEGVAAAKDAGHIPGRRTGAAVNTRRGLECRSVILKTARSFGGNMKDKDLIKLLSCGRESYYKWKKELACELSSGKSREEILDEMENERVRIEAGYKKKERLSAYNDGIKRGK